MDAMSLDCDRSANDLKSYRVITLSSGLECLLISSKAKCEAKGEVDVKATAAMAVQVGSFADPKVAEGCAHFLEHMVFMGSAKYPGENHYDAFVTSHGGSCNAYTEGEFTAYQFDVNATHFAEALDIFANCFIAPVLATSAADREINAIDSEFMLAKVDDGSRLQQLFCHQAVDGHLLRKFSWGNLWSLKTCTENHGVDLHSILRDFHSLHYVPANMKLVMLAPLTLDELANLAVKSFGVWENPFSTLSRVRKVDLRAHDDVQQTKKLKTDTALQTPSVSALNLSDLDKPQPQPDEREAEVRSLEDCLAPYRHVPVLPVTAMGVLTRVVPLKSTHRLSLSWQLPPYGREYRSKPCAYIAHLLGHEGAGSVLSFLKHRNYATGLSAGVSESNMDDNSMFTLFEVSVQLTELGLAHWMYVVQVVHAYLRMLRENPLEKRVFDEIQQVCRLAYQFLDEEEPSDYAERLAVEMLPLHGRLPRGDVLSAAHLLWDWRPDLIEEILGSHLTVVKTKLTLSSSAFARQEEDAVEPHEESVGGGEDQDSDAERSDGAEHEEDDEDVEAEDGPDEDVEGGDDSSGKEREDDVSSGDDNESDGEEEEGEDSSHRSEGGGGKVQPSLTEKIRTLYTGPAEWLPLVLPPDDLAEPSTEPHFGTKYWETPLPSSVVDLWSADPTVLATSAGERTVRLHLPAPNLYIAQDLTLVTPEERSAQLTAPTESSTNRKREPEKIVLQTHSTQSTSSVNQPVEGSGVVLWHLTDVSFGSPKVEISVHLTSPHACDTVRGAVCADLLAKLLAERLNEETYMAAMADLYCQVKVTDIGIRIEVSGFSDKAGLLTTKAVRTLLSFAEQDDGIGNPPEEQVVFARLRELLLRQYSNACLKAKHSAEAARLCALKPSRHHPALKKAALERRNAENEQDIDLRAVLAFVTQYVRNAHLEFVVQGNLTRTAAVGMVRAILDGDSSVAPAVRSHTLRERFHQRFHPPQSIVQLPSSRAVVLWQAPDSPQERNACSEVYFQVGAWDLQLLTKLDLVEQLVTEKFFDDLRTKQQLGYSVSCGVRQTYGTLGFCFQVVASKFPVEALTDAVLKFVAEMPEKIIGAYSSEEYTDNLRALRGLKRQPEQSLNDAARTLRDEIEEGNGCFYSAAQQAALLDDETAFPQTGMVEFSRRVFLSAPRLLIVQSTHGPQHPIKVLPEPFRACKVECNTSDVLELSRLYPACSCP